MASLAALPLTSASKEISTVKKSCVSPVEKELQVNPFSAFSFALKSLLVNKVCSKLLYLVGPFPTKQKTDDFLSLIYNSGHLSLMFAVS